MHTYKRTVFCTFQFAAMHNWPEAPENVEYLRHPHRHLFKVVATAEVEHNDRDIEFITLKQMLQEHCNENYAEQWIGRTSCEEIAQELLETFTHLSTVSVSEDGENGATLKRVDAAIEAH